MRLKTNSTYSSAAILLLLATACGANERTVRGQLATDQFALSGAQAVAVDEAGQTYRVPVAADGRFQVALPVGKTYQVRFANSTNRPGVYDAFAVLVNHDKNGQAFKRFKLSSGEAIDLGRVQRSNTRSLALSAADDDNDDNDDNDDSSDDDDGDTESSSSDDNSDDSDSSDDGDSSSPSEDDVDQICDLSSGSDMSSVSGTTSALSVNDRDDDGISDADDDSDSSGDSSSDSCDDSDSDDTDSDSDDGDNDDSMDDADSDSDSDSSGGSNDCDADDSMDDDCSTPPGEGVSDPIPPVDGNQSGPGGI
ncbi:MAG: hypothetical protein IPG45_14800 [Deltaproteobacteria bacterium]|nr:hypothetical protein [Deltaproteobacteria bacterium]